MELRLSLVENSCCRHLEKTLASGRKESAGGFLRFERRLLRYRRWEDLLRSAVSCSEARCIQNNPWWRPSKAEKAYPHTVIGMRPQQEKFVWTRLLFVFAT